MTQVNIEKNTTELILLGEAILGAQKVEFGLYGIVSHLKDTSAAQSKKFGTLTPEIFLRGDPEDLKKTLGQLVKEFGDKLFLTTADLNKFVDERNLIAHNYFRLAKADIKGGKRLENPENFLMEFIKKCDHWTKVLTGLIAIMKEEIAKKQRKEILLTENENICIKYYYKNVERHFVQ